jgi:hypothetical protein
MHGIGASDAIYLTQVTRFPRFVWVILWLVFTLGALWIGGHLLI